jgi:hypothetical protein
MAQDLPDMVDAIAAAQSELSEQTNHLQSMIDEINDNGTLTVSLFGSTTVLSLAQLNQLDIWNLHTLVAAKTYVETSAKSALTDATPQLRDTGELPNILRNWEEAKNALLSSQSYRPEFTQNIIDLFETSVRDGEEWGRWALNKGLGMLSLFCSGSASAASGGARHVANAAGIAIATLNTLVSSLQAMEIRQNTDDFLNQARDGFDERIEFLSQFVRLASQYLSSYGAGIPADFGTLVNVAATLKDLLADAGVSLCEKLGVTARFCGGEGLPTPTVPDWDSACGYDNNANLAGATAIWSVGDPIPYDGRGLVCADRNGDLWLNHNGVAGGWLLVDSVAKGGPHPGFAGCFSEPAILLHSGVIIGGDWICPL